MAILDEILRDPDYQALQPSEQVKVRRGFLRNVVMQDEDFKGLVPEERRKVIHGILFPGPEERQPSILEPLKKTGKRLFEIGKQAVTEGLETTGRMALSAYESLDPTRSAVPGSVIAPIEAIAGIPAGVGRTVGAATQDIAREAGAGPEVSAALATGADIASGLVIPSGAAARAGRAASERIAEDVAASSAKKVAGDLARADAEKAVQVAAKPVVREVAVSPKAQARTSELLEAAEKEITPSPTEASRTLQAAMETTAGKETGGSLAEQAARRRVISSEPIPRGPGPREIDDVISSPVLGEPKRIGKIVTEPPTRPEIEEAKAVFQEAAKPESHFGGFKALYSGSLEESGTTISRFGETGKQLAQTLRAIRDDAEREAGTYVADLRKSLSNLTTLDEKANLVEVLDKGAAPVSRNVAEIAAKERAKLNAIADRATEASLEIRNPVTGAKVPFTPRQNFFPHTGTRSLEEIARDPRARAKAVQTIQKQEGTSLEEAGKIFDAMVKNSRGRYGHLEVARLYDFGDYDKNPLTALSTYYSRALRRLNEAERLGAGNEKAYEAAELIGQQFGDRAKDFAKTLVDRMTGRETLGLGGKIATDIGGTVRGFEAATKLGQAVIANSSQTALTAVVAGVKNTARAVKAAMTKEGQEFALKSGATLSSTLHDFMREAVGAGGRSLGERAGETVLKATGFLAVEKANRAIAANAGRFYAQDAFEKILSNPKSRSAINNSVMLRRMGVDLDAALKRGELSETDLLKAGQSIVQRTQFKTDPTELPLFWSSPAGKIVTQFKSFAFRSGKLLKDDVLKPAREYLLTGGRRGSLGPITRAATILPLAGEAVEDLRAAIRGKRRPDDVLTRIAEDYAAVGTLGLFMDTWRAASFGKGGVLGLIAGPAVSDVAEAGTGVMQAVQGKPRTLSRFAARNVPVVGSSLAGVAFPSEQEEKRRLRRSIGLP